MTRAGPGFQRPIGASHGSYSALYLLGLIAHHVRDEGVAGSNPATPTNTYLNSSFDPAPLPAPIRRLPIIPVSGSATFNCPRVCSRYRKLDTSQRRFSKSRTSLARLASRFFNGANDLVGIRRTANGDWRRGGNKDVAISHVKEALEVGKELCILALSESPHSA